MEPNATFPPFAITPEIEAEADKRILQYPEDRKRSAVLPLLHIVQHKFGFISKEATEWVAAKLGLEPMQVYEVVSFYPGFREHAPGKYHFRICRTLSHNPIAVSPCGQWSVEFAECLASCGTGPVCMVNDDFHEDVAPEKAEELLAKYNA